MPTTPRTFCEQCLRDTTTRGDCEQHPFSRQLSMARTEDAEHYRVMRGLQRSHQLRRAGVVAYLFIVLMVGAMYTVLEPGSSVVEAFIATHLLLIAVLAVSSPVVVALWFFGVLSRDLLLGIRRRIWGIRIEELPEMLTAPIDDPDPMLSAEEARLQRQIHREARAKVGYGRFLR